MRIAATLPALGIVLAIVSACTYGSTTSEAPEEICQVKDIKKDFYVLKEWTYKTVYVPPNNEYHSYSLRFEGIGEAGNLLFDLSHKSAFVPYAGYTSHRTENIREEISLESGLITHVGGIQLPHAIRIIDVKDDDIVRVRLEDVTGCSDYRPYRAEADAEVCAQASDTGSAWHDEQRAALWVDEARRRELTLAKCKSMIFANATDETVCEKANLDAVTRNQTTTHAEWQSEAEKRHLTKGACYIVRYGEVPDWVVCNYIRIGRAQRNSDRDLQGYCSAKTMQCLSLDEWVELAKLRGISCGG